MYICIYIYIEREIENIQMYTLSFPFIFTVNLSNAFIET